MNRLISVIKNATQKKFLWGMKPIYELQNILTEVELTSIETEYGFEFPSDIRVLLLSLGVSCINDLYIHGSEMIYPFDANNGRVEGFVTFASDSSGNYYAFNPKSVDPNIIYYYCHDPLGYAVHSSSAKVFLQAFVDNNFDICCISESLELIDIEQKINQ